MIDEKKIRPQILLAFLNLTKQTIEKLTTHRNDKRGITQDQTSNAIRLYNRKSRRNEEYLYESEWNDIKPDGTN
jgi:Mg2+/Co2+ transporter CorB